MDAGRVGASRDASSSALPLGRYVLTDALRHHDLSAYATSPLLLPLKLQRRSAFAPLHSQGAVFLQGA